MLEYVLIWIAGVLIGFFFPVLATRKFKWWVKNGEPGKGQSIATSAAPKNVLYQKPKKIEIELSTRNHLTFKDPVQEKKILEYLWNEKWLKRETEWMDRSYKCNIWTDSDDGFMEFDVHKPTSQYYYNLLSFRKGVDWHRLGGFEVFSGSHINLYEMEFALGEVGTRYKTDPHGVMRDYCEKVINDIFSGRV
jgi:hypothetical protein